MEEKQVEEKQEKAGSAVKLKCLQCKSSFTTKSGLSAHIAAKHAPTGSARCAMEIDASTSSIALIGDMGSGGSKPFSCGSCAAGFKSREGLKSHMKAKQHHA